MVITWYIVDVIEQSEDPCCLDNHLTRQTNYCPPLLRLICTLFLNLTFWKIGVLRFHGSSVDLDEVEHGSQRDRVNVRSGDPRSQAFEDVERRSLAELRVAVQARQLVRLTSRLLGIRRPSSFRPAVSSSFVVLASPALLGFGRVLRASEASWFDERTRLVLRHVEVSFGRSSDGARQVIPEKTFKT